ncbi:DNA/RNA non-specific endonuclease [Siphonobacter sp.]|uniref:DNA/RNA non-specific endonuclease n=1 Tax=Siphonobacter sp. TaxID=1869184 RepID=UPI003B3B1469
MFPPLRTVSKASLCSILFALLLLADSCSRKPLVTPTNDRTLPLQAYLGLPSRQSGNLPNDSSEYLLYKPAFVVSYLPEKGIARWVSWHLQKSDLGTTDRQDDFRPDEDLPRNFPPIKPTDYTNSGFDRGHLCPSGDRTATQTANSATFVMSNMIPQAPSLNRGIWNDLEEYCRTKIKLGYEAYLYAGGYGAGGKGSNGSATTIAKGKVSVPGRCWKVILIMPEGENDYARLEKESVEVIAVDMPNSQDVAGTGWRRWQLSVRQLEELTGLDFFSALPRSTQDRIENHTPTF